MLTLHLRHLDTVCGLLLLVSPLVFTPLTGAGLSAQWLGLHCHLSQLLLRVEVLAYRKGENIRSFSDSCMV